MLCCVGELAKQLAEADALPGSEQQQPAGAAAAGGTGAGQGAGGAGLGAADAAWDAESLLRVLELNCFSESGSMDPGLALGAQLLRSDKGVAARVGAGSSSSSKMGVLGACDFLALAAAAQAAGQAQTGSSAGQQQGKTAGKSGAKGGRAGSKGKSTKSTGGPPSAQALAKSLPPHVGLWTEHAWMNHSCAPNVVNYVLGDAMVGGAGKGETLPWP